MNLANAASTAFSAYWTGSSSAGLVNSPGSILNSAIQIVQDVASLNITRSTLGHVASAGWNSFILQGACSNIYTLNPTGFSQIGALAGSIFGTTGAIVGAGIASFTVKAIHNVIESDVSRAIKDLYIG